MTIRHSDIFYQTWDEKPVIKQIQDKVIQLIGDENNGSLHFDESGNKNIERDHRQENHIIGEIKTKMR